MARASASSFINHMIQEIVQVYYFCRIVCLVLKLIFVFSIYAKLHTYYLYDCLSIVLCLVNKCIDLGVIFI